MPNTDTFAAKHGQNRSRGLAVRSDSGMISIPARSIRAGISGVVDMAASDVRDCAHPGIRRACARGGRGVSPSGRTKCVGGCVERTILEREIRPSPALLARDEPGLG